MRWVIPLLLLPLPLASAQEIVSYNVSVWLGRDSAQEEIWVEIYNQNYFPLKTFSYVLRGDVRDIEVYDSLGSLGVNISRGEETVIQSSFREPLQPNASTGVGIRFNVANAVRRVEEGYVFSPVFSLPPGTGEFRLRVRLPEGMGLQRPVSGASGFTDVAPLPDRVFSDGRAIIFEWRRLSGEGDFAVYIRFAEPYPGGWGLYVAGFLLVLLALGYYFFRRRGKPEEIEDDKKKVLDLIRKKEGIIQKEIVDITGFSKAKVSMIISSLEKDGLIRKERLGLKNRLYPVEKYK